MRIDRTDPSKADRGPAEAFVPGLNGRTPTQPIAPHGRTLPVAVRSARGAAAWGTAALLIFLSGVIWGSGELVSLLTGREDRLAVDASWRLDRAVAERRRLL